MQQELRPVYQTLIDLGERGGVILGQFYALPELGGEMGALDRFHVEVESTIVAADSGIARVCQWAGLTVTEAGDLGRVILAGALEKILWKK